MNKEDVYKRVRNWLIAYKIREDHEYYIPVAVSNRHVHLSEKDVAGLFGENYTLTKLKDLSQPGQYACKETVTLIGPKGVLSRVRVLGPPRRESQVEISQTDSFALGIKVQVRMSGDLSGSPGIVLEANNRKVELKEGLIIAARHLHISDDEAELFGIRDMEELVIQKKGEREISFSKVVARVGSTHSLEMHIDTDEANAGLIHNNELLLLRTNRDKEKSG